MRILLLSAAYAPRLGGLQTVVGALAGEWQKMGRDVHVVTQRYPRQLSAHEEIEGVPVWRRTFLMPDPSQLKRGRPDLFLAGLYYRTATRRWLDRHVQEFQPQVINMHFPDAQIPFVLSLKKRFPFHLAVSLHGHDILRWFDDEGRLISTHNADKKMDQVRSVLYEADAVTACSGYLLEKTVEIQPAVREKGHVIHNGVDMARFKGKTAYSHPRAYCLAYGRLTYKKGFDLLVRAFAAIAQKHPELDLILAGEGESKRDLETMVHELGLTGRVVFFGRATAEQVVELLLGCKFLVVPSRVEAFGVVALEGLAAGKVILATNVGGLPEILTGIHNRLAEPTVGGLAEGMEGLLASKDLDSIGRRNRSLVEEFSWEVAAQKYTQIFGKDTSDN